MHVKRNGGWLVVAKREAYEIAMARMMANEGNDLLSVFKL